MFIVKRITGLFANIILILFPLHLDLGRASLTAKLKWTEPEKMDLFGLPDVSKIPRHQPLRTINSCPVQNIQIDRFLLLWLPFL